MFKKISAAVMVLVMVAMLSVTAFAEVDREAVEVKLVEHLWYEVDLDRDDDYYHIPVEDNPTSTLYYSLYIKPFVYESDEATLEHLDLTDESTRSVNHFVRNYYSEWEAEQPDMIDYLMNDGNHYEYVEEQGDNWIFKDSDGNLQELVIEKNDTSFIFSVDDKELGTYDRLFKYAYLNDYDEIAYDEAERNGTESEIMFEDSDDSNGTAGYSNNISASNAPVTKQIVSEADRAAQAATANKEEGIPNTAIPNEEEGDPNTAAPASEENKSNTPVIVGVSAVVSIIAVSGVMYFKKCKKEN